MLHVCRAQDKSLENKETDSNEKNVAPTSLKAINYPWTKLSCTTLKSKSPVLELKLEKKNHRYPTILLDSLGPCCHVVEHCKYTALYKHLICQVEEHYY